jgi:hypothetical protein
MKGEGQYADTISAMFRMARKKYFTGNIESPLDYSKFTSGIPIQMKIF